VRSDRFSVSAVLPVFDEAPVIAGVVRELHGALARHAARFEIVAVDDGSSDGSGAELERVAAELPGVRVIHFERNRGYGHALRAGFAACTHELTFFMDSDGQFDPDELRLLLAIAPRADIVVGHRLGRTDGALRSVLSRGYNWLTRRALAIEVSDVNCAFKLMRRDALASLALAEGGYVINAELLAKAARAGLTIAEVGVTHRPRTAGRTKTNLFDVPRAARRLFALRRSL
jgi:glycosyltransferase involved in cell wall biosynthesis